jgi:ubiquinone/menaquinone biosynthesis C-methylase UbiE
VPTAALPAYDPLQSAFHEAFRDDLYRAIDALPIKPRMHVLDAPCGDGFYARRLAERLSPAGRLTLVDANPTYLGRVERALADAPPGVAVEVRPADVYSLPFPDAAFDLVWCGQSLISLEDNVRALRELYRVTRPGGRIAVLESDEFHHVLLPWPVDLELAVQRAVHKSSRRRYGSGSRLAPSRHLRRTLMDAGWKPTRKLTVPSDRTAPFRPAEAEFLTRHLEYLGRLVSADLAPADREQFDRFAGPGLPDAFVRKADMEMTCINTIHLARKTG